MNVTEIESCQRDNYFRERYVIRLNEMKKFYFRGFLIQGAIIWASFIKYLNTNVRYQRYSTLFDFFFLDFFPFHQSTCGGGGIREHPEAAERAVASSLYPRWVGVKEQVQAPTLPFLSPPPPTPGVHLFLCTPGP
jgi:hypothetical protein